MAKMRRLLFKAAAFGDNLSKPERVAMQSILLLLLLLLLSAADPSQSAALPDDTHKVRAVAAVLLALRVSYC